ncbi:MAG TPA: S8/S53 family peptidase [Candidatus Thermoplasmatota archaeon]|nr:S8/S53 family peptidase [Candidatus Thermoplasmatota archaeon]
MTGRGFPLLVLALLVAGCAAPNEVDTATTDGTASSADGADAVIAFIDEGINPYHVAFRDDSPRAKQHPSTYLPTYPANAKPLHLSLHIEDLEDAIVADCAVWAEVVPETLYYVPGTRIVGMYMAPNSWLTGIFEYGDARYTCGGDPEEDGYPLVGFGFGHGTMVASRAAGNGYGACPTCLIVMVQHFGPEAVAWASEQPWIDVQSNSWGPLLPLYFPVGAAERAFGSDAEFLRAVEAAAARQPAFWASGNGALFRFGVLGHPTQLAPHFTPSMIRVGGHDSGRVAVWPGSTPHVVSDACWSWAAEHYDTKEETARSGGGTSAATPFVAGIAAAVVKEARAILGDPATGIVGGVLARGENAPAEGPLADGDLTVAELRALLFATADPRPDRIHEDGDVCEPTSDPFNALYPGTPVEWRSVPEGAPAVPLVGYGAVDPTTLERMRAVLRGDEPLPARGLEDAFFEADAAYHAAKYDALARR